jgi:hypothetical protein
MNALQVVARRVGLEPNNAVKLADLIFGLAQRNANVEFQEFRILETVVFKHNAEHHVFVASRAVSFKLSAMTDSILQRREKYGKCFGTIKCSYDAIYFFGDHNDVHNEIRSILNKLNAEGKKKTIDHVLGIFMGDSIDDEDDYDSNADDDRNMDVDTDDDWDT